MAAKSKSVVNEEAQDGEILVLDEIEYGAVRVKLVGVTPLLTNRMDINEIIKPVGPTGKAVKEPLTEDVKNRMFNSCLYAMTSGGYGFPSAAVKKSIVTGGGRYTKEKMTRLRGMINVLQEEDGLLRITGSDPRRVDHVARNHNAGKGAVPAIRAQFDEWELEATIVYMSQQIDSKAIYNLLNLAGFAVGIGVWRPECNGTFGQFRVGESEEFILPRKVS